MFHFSVGDDGSVGEFARDWDTFVRVVSDSLPEAVSAACKAGVIAAQPHIPIRTGKLQKSGKSRITSRNRFSTWGEMRWSKDYASFVDEGTRRHDIRPKFSGRGAPRPGQRRRGSKDVGTTRVALRFLQGGETRFARVVHHPGTQGRHFSDVAKAECTAVLIKGVLQAFTVGQRALRMRNAGMGFA